MEDLRNLYEEKFNSEKSTMQIDKSWIWYFDGNESLIPKQRYNFSISKLYGNVLDVGAADGYGTYLMLQNKKINHITGVEIHDKSIESFKKNIGERDNVVLIKCIAEKMPFKDDSFDCIHCGATLEHVTDQEAVLLEIKRCLKDILVISVPINGGLDTEHIHEYKTVDEFENMIGSFFNILEKKVYDKGGNQKTVVLICKK